ncbi:MAG TPA: ABC transporter permease [Puia sp.]|nr:ABC transporter permease [Puia sp.]
MLKNYLTITFRNLTRNRTTSIINIGGLAVGMAVALLIGLWIHDELSFNKYHSNYDAITQVTTHARYPEGTYTISSQPMPLAQQLRTNTNFKYVVMSVHEQHLLSFDGRQFNGSGNYMEPDAPDMLTLKMLAGSHAGLKDPQSILLNASLAKKLFGNTDPIGNTVQIDNKYNVKVTGVYEDIPDNSDFHDVAYIIPFDNYLSSFDWAKKKSTNWNNIAVSVYTLLQPGVDLANASASIRNTLIEHATGEHLSRHPVLFLHPMSRWHLYSQFENGVSVTSTQLQYLRFYGLIGALVLLLACINFMNLSTARSAKRAKEVGIRKTMGAPRSHLIKQFFGESIIVAALAFILAIVLAQLALPLFNEVAGKRLSIPCATPLFWLACIAFTVFTGLIAGSYPAIYLSSFQPVKVLKGLRVRQSLRAGKGFTGRLSVLPRQVLVTFQFTISIMLIIGTLIVHRQIQYAKDRPIGYTTAGIIQLPISPFAGPDKYDVLSRELKNTPGITSVASSASPATSIWSTNRGFTWEGKKNTSDIEFATINITSAYGKTIGWHIVKGRDFSEQLTTDSTGLVINQAAANLMGLQDPVGATVRWDWDQGQGQTFHILGVVRDMVVESPYNAATPTLFFIYAKDGMNCLLLRMAPHMSTAATLEKVETLFKKTLPTTPFEYSFVDENFNSRFAAEQRTGRLAGIFSALAIFISCLGLFGLASYTAEQRTKEIGVRKVLGATIFNIWGLLTKDFITLVVISLLIASPLAWTFMHGWLQNYQYRTTITGWIFATAGLGAITLTILTVSFQSIKAALTNPVDSLRADH